jgi:hypothetical protein
MVASVALYVIIHRWPDPGALAGGFTCLVLAVGGIAASWYWKFKMIKVIESVSRALDAVDDYLTNYFDGLLPHNLYWDRTEDQDLALEGAITSTTSNRS